MSRLPLVFGAQVCGDLSAGAAREWIVPDGCGGFAMGTVSGLRTRRYHGLLVASGEHPGARRVGLVALDPVITINGTLVSLAVHEWASGALAPTGHLLLESFTLDEGLPRWRWRIGDTVLERRLAMVAGRPAIGVVHRLISGPPVRLTLTALGTWRDAHGERYASGPAPTITPTADGVVIDGAYRVAGPGFAPDGSWFYGARLREEAARGLPDTEDLWCAGRFGADLSPGESLDVTAWVGDLDSPPPPAPSIIDAALARRRLVIEAAKPLDDVDATLALAADAFVIKGPDVIAGYPWFGAWSRDTMTSYEGLFLTAGRAAEGRAVLLRYGAALSGGMLPNTADIGGASGEVAYNSIDAPLWFVHAVGRHVARTGDTDLAAELLPGLTTVIDAYLAGTRFGIGVDARGLVVGGAPGTALTWMDARVNGVPVTPRSGAPVEINALWINALGTMAALRAGVPTSGGEHDAAWFSARRVTARSAFLAAFAADHGLPDVAPYMLAPDVSAPHVVAPHVVAPHAVDASLRPNQLLAYALPYGPLHGTRPAAELDAALLTPLGMRTLAPGSPGYQGAHRGDGASRDRAYHQGTVWPWLIGPYVEARRAAALPTDGLLDGLTAHLTEFGLGSISETADGDAPHLATGCPYQAWSVAQVWQARRALMS